MRSRTWIVVGLSLLTFACSHTEKKNEHSDIKAPTPVIKSTHNPENGAADPDAPKKSRAECAVKGDERVLEIKTVGTGCELHYTKAGKDGIVANSAHNGTTYCESALDKLQARLTGAGFSCK